MTPMRLGWAVCLVAAGVLGFEISLMRLLLVASWHHFAFLVISIALLGFGASGTALSLMRTKLLPRGEGVLFALVLLTALSMPTCFGIAQHVPVAARFTPALVWREMGSWLVYWTLLGIPFFLGAGAIGLGLMMAGHNVARIYAANLLGSAVGLMLAIAAMCLVEPQWLPLPMGGLALVGTAFLRPKSWITRLGAPLVCAAIVAGQLAVDPPHVRLDPYKYGAYAQRLMQQGEAERAAAVSGPRAFLEAYRSEAFHDLEFLSVGATPPPMTVLVADGHNAGSVLNIARLEEAEVMDYTIMAFPYALLEAREPGPEEIGSSPFGPRVLLLGERGGTNVWLAARHGAPEIHFVQPDANIISLLRDRLHGAGGSVVDLPAVHVAAGEPRHFVDHGSDRFDLIQLVTLSAGGGSAAGSGGVAGLVEDHLITVEGITACLRRLTDDGLLVAVRGIQTPPRDNFKIFSTFSAAFTRIGVTDPGHHIVIVRDYLGVCTVARRSPWTSEQIEHVRRACTERELTPVWFTGIRSDELNQPDAMPGPPGEEGDWYHHAAMQLLASRQTQLWSRLSGKTRSDPATQFINDWPFDIRPPTDDRPFFLDFCKLTSIGHLKRVFGDMWLTRTELAFLFVLAAIVAVGAIGAALTLVPLLFLRQTRRASGWRPMLGYFAAIGLGYLLLEMTFLSRLTRWVGDPVSAAAVTIAGFLLASGLGSLTAQRLAPDSTRTIRRIIAVLIVTGAIELAFIGRFTGMVGSLPHTARCGLAFLAILPLGFLCGFPMPAALARLHRGAPALIPWAWGVNGFASVLAAPAATAMAMTWGYTAAGVTALALYVFPAVVLPSLPEGEMPKCRQA